jgi:hypothetical protein
MADATDDFFATYPADVQYISRILRAMVQKAAPGAHELLFTSQNHVAYSTSQSRADTQVYICPLKDYVRFGFMYGSNLSDPSGILVGEGKRLRHVKVRSVQEAGSPSLERLVVEAWADVSSRVASHR